MCTSSSFAARALSALIEHIQKLEILHEFDVRFHTKERSPVCHVLLTEQNMQRRALLFIDNRQFSTIHWIFTQTKLSSIYRQTVLITYWALKKRQALLTIKAKLKLAIIFSVYF